MKDIPWHINPLNPTRRLLVEEVECARLERDTAWQHFATRALERYEAGGADPPWARLTEAAQDVLRWQHKTFPTATYEGAVRKLRNEVNELMEAPLDKQAEELADCFFMLVAAADHAGIPLAEAVQEKLAINQRRTWRDNGDGSSSHVKGETK